MSIPNMDQIVGALSKGNRNRLGIISQPAGGPLFLWRRCRFQIVSLDIFLNGTHWDKSSFTENVFLKQARGSKPAWYVLADADLNCTRSSLDGVQSDLTIYAMMVPTKPNSHDPNNSDVEQNIPICLKALFNQFGSAAALIQDQNIALLWQAERDALLSKYSHMGIQTKKVQAEDTTNEGGLLEDVQY